MAETNNYYIVPLNVQGLRTTAQDTGAKFKGPTANFENVTTGLGIDLQQQLPVSQSALAAGVHLHWALPDAITHAHQQPDQTLLFPKAPNRWLVTRYFADFNTDVDCNNTRAEASGPGANGSFAPPVVTQWIVESNVISQNGQPNTQTTQMAQVVNSGGGSVNAVSNSGVLLPNILPDAPALQMMFLGDRIRYDQNWQDDELSSHPAKQYDPDLNAISHYGASFSAYYQNCGTVFGFHDDFSDNDVKDKVGDLNTANFSVSYHVIGWYNQPANDVLSQALTDARAAYAAQNQKGSQLAFFYDYVAQTLAWQLQEAVSGTPPDDNWPQAAQSLFSGMALNIQWLTMGNPDPQFLPDPQNVGNAFKLDLAIGNNTAEAFSALIRNKKIVTPPSTPGTGDPFPELESHIELLFNAFQQDLLRRLAGSDPGLHLSQLEEYLHNTRFGSATGGNIWGVRSLPAPGGSAPSNPNSAGDDEVQLPLAAVDLLSLLNAAQQEYDEEIADLNSRQQQAFLDWTRYGLLIQAGNSPQTDTTADQNEAAGNYLISELLQLFSQSSETGYIQATTQQDGTQNLAFQPVWTQTNGAAQQQITTLANAQAQLWFLFPKMLNALLAPLLNVQATLAAGNAQGALNALLQVQPPPAPDPGPVVASLNATLTQLATEQKMLQTNLVAGTSSCPTLSDVQQAYQPPFKFPAIQTLKNFISCRQNDFFNTTNLVDTQQVFVWVEATQFGATELSITKAKLDAAVTWVQAAATDLTGNIIPAFKTALSDFSGIDQTITSQLGKIATAIQQVVKELQAYVLGGGVGAIEKITSDLAELVEEVQQVLADEPTRIEAGLSMQQAWQSLLNYLPSGHRVVILAQVMQEAAGMLSAGNVLQRGPAPAYWAPNEPVVLLTESKDDQNVLLPVNRNGKADLLPCRLPQDVLSGLVLNTSPPIDGSVLAGKTSAPKVFSNLGNGQPVVQDLLYEGYLLTPQAAFDVVKNAAGLDEAYANLLICIHGNLVANLATAQVNQSQPPVESTPSSGAGSGSNQLTAAFQAGTLSYYTGLTWFGDPTNNPFLPLFMAWEATFSPALLVDGTGPNESKAVFPPGYVSGNFVPDGDGVDLVCSQPMQLQANPLNLSGQVTLSSRGSVALLQQIRLYLLNQLGKDIAKGQVTPADLQNDFQRDLYDAYVYFDTKVILSQSLSGFNSGLLQQLQILQLPVNQNVAVGDRATELFNFLAPYWQNQQFSGVSVDSNTAINAFIPLRAGKLSVKKLFIVDAFGRFFQIGDEDNPVQGNLIVANSLQPSQACQQSDIYLAPRFVQPTRLSFNWLSANSLQGNGSTFVERAPQPAASPICGWMLPNHLEDSLVLYDAGGNPLGSIGIEGVNQEVTWRSVPQAGISSKDSLATDNGRLNMLHDIAGANPFLQDFLKDFAFPTTPDAASLQGMLDAMEQSQRFIHTSDLQQDKGLAVLIGRPLVLVRATLQLDLQGLPAVALNMDSFMAAVNQFSNNAHTFQDYDINQRFDGQFTGVSVPVLLGDLNQFDDGLIGFFLNDDWSVFYSAVADGTSGPVQQAVPDTIQLTLNYASQEKSVQNAPSGVSGAGTPQASVVVTMIMDPRANVHATTGMLPVQSIAIPPDQYADVMNRLLVYFLSNPVLLSLADQQMKGIPLPKERGYDWFWTQPGLPDDIALQPNLIGDQAGFGYSPQALSDGWLKLINKKN